MDTYRLIVGLTAAVISLLTNSSDGVALNDYILDYQPLQFDQRHLHEKHNRVRRSVDPYLRFTFKAYNRSFNVQLQPSQSIFADNHELIFGREPPKRVDTSFIYDGHLEGEPTSSVHLSIIDGSISGHIIVPGHTTYHIEPSRNHFKNAHFHSIIYPESHMNLDPYRHKRSSAGICGNDEVYRKLREKWSPVEDIQHKYKRETPSEYTFYNKYSEEANHQHSRLKREIISNKTTCFMSLRADYLLYKHMYDKFKDKAKEEILSLFASHIKALNDIYPETQFGSYRNVNFQLQRSTVMLNCTTYDPRYCTDNLDVSNFLDLTSNENHDSFCLVHTFTYRDFDGGTLGLAWVATPDSRNSGVCGQFGAVRDSKNMISNRSLNTGIVTFINFKQDVPARVSQLTFAHEVGHNFGAPHDTTSQCAPYGTSEPNAASGNYIMFPSATQGNMPNNAKFSSCSVLAISKVLDTLEPSGKRKNCFQNSGNAFCGNGVVEGTEQCDCGYQEQCSDKCCNPKIDSSSISCKLKLLDSCSPSQGPCCSSECGYFDSSVTCSAATECRASSLCTGKNYTCPKPAYKPDKILCNSFSKTCLEGECIGSVCSNISWTECFITEAQGATEKSMCYVSCKKNETSECVSSIDGSKLDAYPEFKDLLQRIKTLSKSTNIGLQRPAGSPCNDFKGYCDGFSKCRKVDAEGPFKQLTDLIFSPVTLSNIRSWIEEYWWAVLLMCVGVVVFMGVFIKVFGYNTPNKNPKKKTTRPQGAAQRDANRQRRPKSDANKGSTVFSTDLPMYSQPSSSQKTSSQATRSSDLPAYSKPSSSLGAASQSTHDYHSLDFNDGKNGYDNYAFQGPSNQKRHQQFDRIAAPRKY